MSFAFRPFSIVLSLALGAAAPLLADEADDQYAVAAGHYAQGRWQMAVDEFHNFLRDHLEHVRAAQALFFSGEARCSWADSTMPSRSSSGCSTAIPRAILPARPCSAGPRRPMCRVSTSVRGHCSTSFTPGIPTTTSTNTCCPTWPSCRSTKPTRSRPASCLPSAGRFSARIPGRRMPAGAGPIGRSVGPA